MIPKIIIFLINITLFTINYNEATKINTRSIESQKTWSEHPWDLDPFFEEQYYKTLELFSSVLEEENHRQKRSSEFAQFQSKYTVSKTVLVSNTKTDVTVVEVAGEKHILVQDNIFRVHEHADGNLFVEFGYILNIPYPVKLMEGADFHNMTIILMGYDTYSQLFVLSHKANRNWKEAKLQQTFSSESNRPIAAKFLQHEDQLFLVIVYQNKKIRRVNSIIYLWTGTHLDELFTITTDGGKDLAVLKRDDHFLLIIVQENKSYVYKFIPKEGIYRVHKIGLRGVYRVVTYKDTRTERMYALFLSNIEKSKNYRMMNDGEFVATNKTYNFKNVTAAEVAVVEGTTLILLGEADKIQVYKPELEGLKIIHTTALNDCVKILNIKYIDIENGDHALLLLTTTDKITISEILIFSLYSDYRVAGVESFNPFQCISEIENILDDRQYFIDEIEKQVHRISTKDGALIDGVLKVTQDVKLVNSKVGTININPDEELSVNTKDLQETANTVNEAIKRLEEGVSHVITKNGPIEFKNGLEIEGNLIVENLEAKFLNVDSVNGKPFKATSFIFNDRAQHFPDHWFENKIITVRNLTAPLFDPFFSTATVFRSLKADNIILANKKSINDIDLDSIVLKGYEGTIMGTKTFDRLTTLEVDTERLGKELLTPWIQRSLQDEVRVKNLRAENIMTVSHLFAKRINGINVTELMDSTFQKGIHTQIKGDLTFSSDLTVRNLQTELLDDSEVSDFMTKTTEQTVNSSLKVRNIFSRSIDANAVNGIDLSKDIAIIGRRNFVTSPSSIFNLDVLNNLELNCGPQDQNLCNIIPTKPEDLLQMYNGPVTLVGSLTVPDLKFTRQARMRVGGQLINTDFESQFWMKEKSQIIPGNVTFTRGISVPQISAEVINSLPVEDIYSTVNDNRNVSVLMKNVEVRNNVRVPENSDCSMIREVSNSAVRTSGVFRIKGRKKFSNKLQVRNLKTKFMNDLNMKDIVLKSDENVRFSGELHLKTLRIKGDLRSNTDFKSNSVNGFNLSDIYRRALKKNEPATLKNVVFQDFLQVDNLEVQRGNLADIVDSLRDTLRNIQVFVDGDVHIGEIDGIKQINGIDFDDYISMVVLKNQNREIYGNKFFKGDVVVEKDFWSSSVNDLPLERLFSEALTISGDQEIYGKHVFENVVAGGVQVGYINGVNMNGLIDVSAGDVYLESDAVLKSATVLGDVVGVLATPCDLTEAAKSFRMLPVREWDQVTVYGDVNWDYGAGNITRILEKAVLCDRDAVIDAEVVLQGFVSANVIESDSYINDVNVHYIMQDSLKKFSEVPQIVRGRKRIKNDVYAARATISNQLRSEIVNGINIVEFNSTLVRKNGDYFVEGPKVIEADIDIENLMVNGYIHGVPVNDLIVYGDRRIIEEAHFYSMDIRGNLNIDSINSVNFNAFLNDTIKLVGPDQHIFGNVAFETVNIDECRLDSINGIPFEDIVIDLEYGQIEIFGDKIFLQDADISGPARIDLINGYDVVETFNQTVFGSDDVDIAGDVIFEAPVTLYGNIQPLETINNINLRASMDQGLYLIDQSQKESQTMVQNIKDNIDQIFDTIKGFSVVLLYADVLEDVNLSLQEFKKSGSKNFEDKTTLYVNGFHPGDACNLPDFCLCPMHYRVDIFGDASSDVTRNANVPYRIFPLLAPSGILVDVITTTVSLSKECSPDPSILSESTWLSWKNSDGEENYKMDLNKFVTGYISDVKIFFFDRQYYIAISQYYDVFRDSYNTDTVILRMEFDQKSVTLVQRIPTYGAWMLEVLQDKRELYLIVANSFDSVKETTGVESEILRFNRISYQFDSMQKMRTIGCKYVATAIVQEKAYFIIFSQIETFPLVIKKYDPRAEQYLPYQTFSYDSEVKSIEVAYISNRNMREPFLCVATSNQELYIYHYLFSEGWKIHSSGHFSGIQGVIPFAFGLEQYLLAVSSSESKILSLVVQGVF